MMPEFALPPAFIYLLGALIVPFLRGRLRQIFALAVPLFACVNFFFIEKGVHWKVQLLDFELILGRADAWSLIFLNIFTILSFCGILYIIKENKPLDLSAGLLYAGSAMGVVMAGDLITLFFFWEMLTVGAVMCLLARRTKNSGSAAYRYLLVHIFGGVILLAGIMIHLSGGGSVAFDKIELSGLGAWLIFIGFGVNCAWPVLGAWLTDTYPEASFGGIVFMATYTTKTAIYVLARTFPGEEYLIWIGFAMVVIPLFYAVIANDLRRVLAYCLINQVGFMVVAIGLGTALSLNGTAAHAYCHILYKSLLFMSIGSVIYRTGKSKVTELGGLYKSMPLTCVFCCIGAIAISTPYFCGFVSKSLILSAAAKENQSIVWLALLFASAAVFFLAGIKVSFFTFFSRDSGQRPKEAPINQLIAMGIVAFLCVFVGVFPNLTVYKMLPNVEASYNPYTLAHVTDQLALLLFTGLAFALILRAGLYPAAIRSTIIDFDWIYRKGGKLIYAIFDPTLNGVNKLGKKVFIDGIAKGVCKFFEAGASKLAGTVMTPIWSIQGHGADQIKNQRQLLTRKIQRDAVPIGVTAFFAIVLLGLLMVTVLIKN